MQRVLIRWLQARRLQMPTMLTARNRPTTCPSASLVRSIDSPRDLLLSLLLTAGTLREVVYGGDIRTLNDAVADYLIQEKDGVWLSSTTSTRAGQHAGAARGHAHHEGPT